MLHGLNNLVDTAEERTRTGRPAETVGKNSPETCRQSQETPERRDLSRGRGCGPCRRPHLLGGSRPRCRSPAVHTGRAPPRAAVHTVVPLLPESQRPSPSGRVERLGQLALVLRTRLHVAGPSAEWKGFKKESKAKPSVGRAPACGWCFTVDIGAGWVFAVGTVLCKPLSRCDDKLSPCGWTSAAGKG